ncbi:MAG: SDR family oxidoreductase [Xanthomonadales bacterium]|nr:SDR family oxidoreductase [Xanthomonadales bacterium]
MILLSGATGKTGQKLVDLIRSRNLSARAIVRDPEKADALRASGLETVVGDLQDGATLAKAMADVDRAFLLMANTENQCLLEKNFIDAARAAAVSQLVKLSAIGADSGSTAVLKRYHGEVEDYLRQSGLVYTIVQAGFFMDNMFTCAHSIAREDRFYLPMGSGRTAPIDIRDVAEAALAALTQPGHENKTYLITGAEMLSFADMAAVFSEVLGREIQYVDVPEEEFRQQLIAAGLSDWYVSAVLQLFEFNRLNLNAKITGDYTQITGKAPIPLWQFVQDYAARFN